MAFFMPYQTLLNKALNYSVALIWLVNGLFCKVFKLVPRHEMIVASILGETYSRPITVAIGIAETAMAIWIVSGVYRRINTLTQIVIILTMNTLEFTLVPHLLLWGKMNIVFALILCFVIYCNEFMLNRKPVIKTLQ